MSGDSVAQAEARYRTALVGIVLAGVALRLSGLNWDEGRGLHPDEGNLVRAALSLGVEGKLIPAFHAYNDLALWLPRLLSLPFCTTGDSACLTLAARFMSALLSVAAIPLAAGLARQLAGETSGAVAGLITASGFAASAPLVQWAHFGTTESALVLLVVALWRVSALWLSRGISDVRMALWSAAILGLGFGLKTTSVIAATIPLTALVLAGWPDAQRIKAVSLGMVLAIGFGLASTPSLFLAFSDWFAVMRFENGVVTGAIPVFWTAQFQGAAHGWYDLRQLWSATSGAGLVLAFAGLALLPRGARRAAAPALVFAILYALLVFGWQAKFFRYLAPLVPVVLVLAGVGAGRLVVQSISRFVLSLALTGIGLMVLAGLDQATVYARQDPRIAAEAKLLELSAPNAIVAVEPNDLAQTGTRTRLSLLLTESDVMPETLAGQLAKAGWIVIASRRNWAVLPRQPEAPPVICTFYARLARSDLGFVSVFQAGREGLFGRIFVPGLAIEETRTVFDRPEVILLRNIESLPEAELVRRLADNVAPADCTPEALARDWRRQP